MTIKQDTQFQERADSNLLLAVKLMRLQLEKDMLDEFNTLRVREALSVLDEWGALLDGMKPPT